MFDPAVFLTRIGRGRRIVGIPQRGIVFSQCDSCDAVFYIQVGEVKLTTADLSAIRAQFNVPHNPVDPCWLVRAGTLNAGIWESARSDRGEGSLCFLLRIPVLRIAMPARIPGR